MEEYIFNFKAKKQKKARDTVETLTEKGRAIDISTVRSENFFSLRNILIKNVSSWWFFYFYPDIHRSETTRQSIVEQNNFFPEI